MENRSPVPAEFGGTLPPGASNKQLGFIRTLIAERDLTPEARAQFEARLAAQDAANAERGDRAPAEDGISLRRASEFIERLKALPASAPASAQPTGGKIAVEYKELELDSGVTRVGAVIVPGVGHVLRGHYALDTSDLDNFTNDVTFFKVWVGSRGGWKVMMEVSDDEVELTAWPTKREVIARIARDPEGASRLWGHEHSRCGVCSRRLTNDESRALGIGPVCRQRVAAW